ncbi:ABC transporter ATP-binding protein [Proteus mirabilis]|uniref:ABC transporter ATP-binding protein n=1 Tax=Proteus mirabilis TaxID=584 RepID=UPI00073BA077|nr:ABC transporter ATP-binding protein [Proteus mirabilis]KSX93269.1 peptide ABC transporter ATP-binding protein [Proteus mirabilis]MBS3851090.1 ABC transporter ATP-binding protein [Proteus mirabilis]MDC9747999.1 ABC transporter ATP-binding protein [Proteus mirabilis]MDM3804145.1 ABC transporter ATP-binding protein [Proteus mirabilis]MTS86297.1 ATP-binding cassette domain-containing protein [Proteus mirabilis]
MNKAPLIEVDNLCIDFPSARVVNNVSFQLGQERLALVGESGSGKSMTARSLMGLVRKPGKVSANKLHFMGDDLLTYSPKQWNQLRGKTISMVLQDPRYALNPVKTIYQQVEETVKLHQELSHKERHALITETLLSVGLPEQSIYRYPGELSGGMGQRAMIAIALINNPTVLIADEPTSALDAQLRHQILELIITQCAQRDMALLLISHDLPLVAEYCDRVMVMYQGEQVDELEAKALPQATHPYTRTLWTCRPNASTYGTQLPVLDRTLNFKGTPYAN